MWIGKKGKRLDCMRTDRTPLGHRGEGTCGFASRADHCSIMQQCIECSVLSDLPTLLTSRWHSSTRLRLPHLMPSVLSASHQEHPNRDGASVPTAQIWVETMLEMSHICCRTQLCLYPGTRSLAAAYCYTVTVVSTSTFLLFPSSRSFCSLPPPSFVPVLRRWVTAIVSCQQRFGIARTGIGWPSCGDGLEPDARHCSTPSRRPYFPRRGEPPSLAWLS